MTRLYLCEKPSQARDIARVLGAMRKGEGCLIGDGTAVTWCIGHLLEMAPPEAYGEQYKRWDIALLPILPKAWKVEATKAGRTQFKAVKACLAQASEVVIATDADREGETIAREVLELCRYRGPVRRLWLSALDDSSIRKALAGLLPGEKTEALYQAGLGRARADWLFGMNLTRLYTCQARASGVSSVFSVGRVQTPTLKLIVERDQQINQFKPTLYFDVVIKLSVADGLFAARWQPRQAVVDEAGRCINMQAAMSVAQKSDGVEGRITLAETKKRCEHAPLPYDLSTLQQEASRRYGMGVQEVLDIAQSLYEKHKACTYPRTDCGYLPTSQWVDAPEIMAMLSETDSAYGIIVQQADAQRKSRAWNDAKITAHHAIIPNIPNGGRINLESMSGKERQIFDLVCRRYLAQFYPDHEYDQTCIEAVVVEEVFKSRGRITRVSGWRSVIQMDDQNENRRDDEVDAEQLLPSVYVGEIAQAVSSRMLEKQTKPPSYYTEGTLIAAMKSIGKLVADPQLREVLRETAGIGTEATRASIIETLLRRQFVERVKKNLVSTVTGQALINALPDSIKDPTTTARWEQELNLISQGRGTLEQFMRLQEAWIASLVQTGKCAALKVDQTSTEHPKMICADCGAEMRMRKGVAGYFWGCVTYPRCKATISCKDQGGGLNKASRTVTLADGRSCPKCGTGTLVQRAVKNGNFAGKRFLGCSCYPVCTYSEWSR